MLKVINLLSSFQEYTELTGKLHTFEVKKQEILDILNELSNDSSQMPPHTPTLSSLGNEEGELPSSFVNLHSYPCKDISR